MAVHRLAMLLLVQVGILVPLAAAWAQEPGRIYRLGHLGSEPRTSSPASVRVANAYFERLREHGFVEGRNLVVEERYAGGDPSRYPALALDLVRLNVDLITVSGGGVAVRAAKDATSKIPIVMIGVSDPVRAGLIASLPRPGGNVTGLSNFATDLIPKRLQLLKEVRQSD